MIQSNDFGSVSEAVLERIRLAEIPEMIKEVGAKWKHVGPLAALGAMRGEEQYLKFLIAYAREHSISLSSNNWIAHIEGQIARAAFLKVQSIKPRGGRTKQRVGIGFVAPPPPFFAKVIGFQKQQLLVGKKITDAGAICAITLAEFGVENTDELSSPEFDRYEELVESRRVTLSRQRRVMRSSIGKTGNQRMKAKKTLACE